MIDANQLAELFAAQVPGATTVTLAWHQGWGRNPPLWQASAARGGAMASGFGADPTAAFAALLVRLETDDAQKAARDAEALERARMAAEKAQQEYDALARQIEQENA